MAIYSSDNNLVLSWTSYGNFLLRDKPAPVNNLLQLATHSSSEVFINSGGFSKFNNELGAKNLIALKVSGIPVLIAMGIAVWAFRANFLWVETLHHIIVRTKLYICFQVSRNHLPSLVLHRIMVFCADFISCRCLKYFHWEKKLVALPGPSLLSWQI